MPIPVATPEIVVVGEVNVPPTAFKLIAVAALVVESDSNVPFNVPVSRVTIRPVPLIIVAVTFKVPKLVPLMPACVVLPIITPLIVLLVARFTPAPAEFAVRFTIVGLVPAGCKVRLSTTNATPPPIKR